MSPQYFKQPDGTTCGPTALMNIQRYFGWKAYSFETLEELTHCVNGEGASTTWFVRTLCEMGGRYDFCVWRFKEPLEALAVELTHPHSIAVVCLKHSKYWPKGHYFIVSNYDSGIFTCINFGLRLQDVFKEASETMVWLVQRSKSGGLPE